MVEQMLGLLLSSGLWVQRKLEFTFNTLSLRVGPKTFPFKIPSSVGGWGTHTSCYGCYGSYSCVLTLKCCPGHCCALAGRSSLKCSLCVAATQQRASLPSSCLRMWMTRSVWPEAAVGGLAFWVRTTPTWEASRGIIAK